MVDKGELGIGYLFGTGSGLIVSSIGHLLLVEWSRLTHWLGVAVTVGLGASLIFVGLWLWRGELTDEHAWKIAIWCGVGLAFPTLAGILLTIVQLRSALLPMFQSIFMVFIAAGGVVGVLVGISIQLNEQHTEAQALAQRTSVLNRALRHDIRNDINLIFAHVDRLREEEDHVDEIADQILQTGHRIVNLSRAARNLEQLESETREPTDLVPVITDRVASARDTYRNVEITTDLPTTAWVKTNPMLSVVLDNLIENAIQHTGDDSPRVHIDVRPTAASPDQVELRVIDHGPGIPEREIAVLEQDAETALRHCSGVGLWLVKWFVEAQNGEIDFRENQPTGTIVVIRLPASDPVEFDLPGQSESVPRSTV